MRNKVFALGLAFLMLFLSSCTSGKKEGVAASVYKNDILVSKLENEVENSKFAYEQIKEQINNSDNTDEKKEELINTVSKPITYDEALNQKIEYFVLLHEAKKKGFSADFDKCKSEAEKVYNDLKSTSKDDFENYQTLLSAKKYIESNNLSDDDYIKELAQQYYNNACINALKEDFKENHYDSALDVPFEKQYADYVQKLVDKAKVVYYR